jgi:hypothetical protein
LSWTKKKTIPSNAVPDRTAIVTIAGGVNAPCHYGRAARTAKTAPSVVGAATAMIEEKVQA